MDTSKTRRHAGIERRLRDARARSVHGMRAAERELREVAAERETELEEEAQRGRCVEALSSVDDRLRQRLAGIDAALDRIERGEYGVCVDCEEPIPVARLEAVPNAERCIECAERLERRVPGRRSFGVSSPHLLLEDAD